LPNTPLEKAIQVGHHLRETMAGIAINHNDHQLTATLSGGLAAITANERRDSLVQRADAALYSAKAGGRNCTFIHDGKGCHAALDFGKLPPANGAAEIVELINSPPTVIETEIAKWGDSEIEVGLYLPREVISPELALKCDELRRYLEEKTQVVQDSEAHGNYESAGTV
jgi:hypothetical protein